MPKTITRYLPAGMSIKPPSDKLDDILTVDGTLSKKKTKKKQSAKSNQDLLCVPLPTPLETTVISSSERELINDNVIDINRTSVEKYTTQNQNNNLLPVPQETIIEHNLTPPKVICKNKSIILENVEINNSVILHSDINDMSLASLPQKQETIHQENYVIKKNSDNFYSNSEYSRDTTDCQAIITDFKSKIVHLMNKRKSMEQHKIKKFFEEKISYNMSICMNSGNEKTESSVSNGKNYDFSALKPDIVESVPAKCNTKDALLKQINDAPCSSNNLILNSTNSVTKRSLPLLKTTCLEKSVKMSKILNNVVIHGMVIPKPITSIEETFFDVYVLKALKTMKVECAKPVQSYMWPAVQRGLNIFMIGPPQSGKTLAYLPAVSTFAVEIDEKYSVLPKSQGPLVIILCSNETQCKEIGSLINTLIEHKWETVRIGILTQHPSFQDCDILVTVLSKLKTYLEFFSLNRLCHLVIEDANIVLKNESKFVVKFLKTIDEMQRNRSCNKNIQMIVSSKQWTADMDVLMKYLYTPPVVYFENFLEAAKYSDIMFKKKKLNADHKRFHLEDILTTNYNTHKTIVFCNDNEISIVAEYLEMKGIECISISNDLIEDQIFENEDMWCSLTRGRFKVLLCTDDLFKNTIKISDANWVIHYSLPQDLITFQNRFRSLANNIKSPLDNDDDSNCPIKNCSYIFTVADKSDTLFNDFFNELITSQVKYFNL